MSQYSHERNGTYQGDPSMVGRTKTAKGNGVGEPSFKNGSPVKGVPAHSTSEFPKFPGYKAGGKEQRDSKIGKGSI